MMLMASNDRFIHEMSNQLYWGWFGYLIISILLTLYEQLSTTQQQHQD